MNCLANHSHHIGRRPTPPLAARYGTEAGTSGKLEWSHTTLTVPGTPQLYLQTIPWFLYLRGELFQCQSAGTLELSQVIAGLQAHTQSEWSPGRSCRLRAILY